MTTDLDTVAASTAATTTTNSGPRPRLGVLTTHPIQYQAPLYQEIARRGRVQLDVAFLSSAGARPYHDPEFDLDVMWDIDLLDGYGHRFLAEPVNRTPESVRTAHRLISWTLRQDVIVVHGHAQPWMLAGAFTACVTRRPYLMRGEARPIGNATGVRRRVRDLLAYAAVRPAAAGLAIGELNAAFYAKFGVRHQVFAPYSVDNERFAHAAAASRKDRARRLGELNLDANRPVVVFAGKLHEHKRPLDAVEAVRRLGGAVSLILVGDGPLRADVERACRDLPATCVGFVNQRELPGYYGLGNILVLPSAQEPWGLVINEAMACGLVPVVSDVVGSGPDLVRGIGRIVPAGDVAALADGLAAAVADLADPSLPGRIADRVSRYSLTATAQGYEQAALAAVAAGAAARTTRELRRRPGRPV